MPLQQNELLFGVDPGLTSGWCVTQVANELPAGFVVLASGVVRWPERIEGFKELLRLYRPNLVVMEEFRLYAHKAKDQIGSDFPSARVIGIVETWMEHFQLGSPSFQGAALIAGAPPVQVLEEHLPLLHKSEHGRDAYKHCRYFITRARRAASTSKRA